MEWTKISVETTTQGVEAVTAVLITHGITGMEVIDAQERAQFFASTTRTWDYAEESLMVADTHMAYVVFYVAKNQDGEVQTKAIENALGAIQNPEYGSLDMRLETADDETWLHEWKKHFKPLRIGRVVVVPEWETYTKENEDDVVFIIDPGSAFGTGQHQTTQLCVGALQKWVKPGDRVADIGCGSGILSIVSLLLGASYVHAVDVDPVGAIAATIKNAELNPVDMTCLKVDAGDVISDEELRQKIGKGYNVVAANIVADVIMPLAPVAAWLAAPGGLFVASGIITERLKCVADAFAAAGITVLETVELEGWNSVVGQVNA